MTTMKDDKALLPCPFCGDKEFSIVEMTFMHSDGQTKGERIKCQTCGCQVMRSFWNTRTPSLTAPDGVRSALQVALDVDLYFDQCDREFIENFTKDMQVRDSALLARAAAEKKVLLEALKRLTIALNKGEILESEIEGAEEFALEVIAQIEGK